MASAKFRLTLGTAPGEAERAGPANATAPPGTDTTSTLQKADCIDASQCANPLTKAGGVPDLGKYFYDASAGMLFFYAAQEFPNALGPSPLGSCHTDGTGDPSCPQFHNEEKETYYPCPPQGCITYVVTLADSTYVPAPSTCTPYANEKYTQPAPAPKYRLGYLEATNGVHAAVVRRSAGGLNNKFPHYTPATAPVCKP